MSERTDKEVLDEWIDEHVKATGLALEVVTEAIRREVSVPNLVGHITSIYADQMPQFISYVASEKAGEMRLGQIDRLSDEIHRLDEENNQLRELVRDLYSQLLYAYDPKEIDEYRDRMCELEIEVEE